MSSSILETFPLQNLSLSPPPLPPLKNNVIFPLAFTIVNEKNNFNWRWFLLYLHRYVTIDRICRNLV